MRDIKSLVPLRKEHGKLKEDYKSLFIANKTKGGHVGTSTMGQDEGSG